MMRILYGTTNKGKLQAMEKSVQQLDIEIIGLNDLRCKLPEIDKCGKITGRYRNAIYFILDEEHHYWSMDMSIATEPFILSSKPHTKRVEGFPLDSLSIDIEAGKYYYDIEVKDVSTSVDEGVRKFFIEALKI